MEGPIVKVNLEHGICTVTINRPKSLNALNSALIEELTTTFNSIEKDTSVKAVILTGSGDKVFVAGADIVEMADMNTVQAMEFSRKGQGLSVISKP